MCRGCRSGIQQELTEHIITDINPRGSQAHPVSLFCQQAFFLCFPNRIPVNRVKGPVKAFAEWFGSAETQIAWSDAFDSYPCNEEAVAELFDEVPPIYAIKNCSLTTVPGTEMTYAEYVGAHSSEWTNIMTNLGFFWADSANAPAEPDWDNLDWATLTQKQE